MDNSLIFQTMNSMFVLMDVHLRDHQVLMVFLKFLFWGHFCSCTYSTSLSEAFHQYEIPYQIYAEDTRVYISISAGDTCEVNSCRLIAQHCARDVLVWMIENWLKNNTDKIEIAVFAGLPLVCHDKILDFSWPFSRPKFWYSLPKIRGNIWLAKELLYILNTNRWYSGGEGGGDLFQRVLLIHDIFGGGYLGLRS